MLTPEMRALAASTSPTESLCKSFRGHERLSFALMFTQSIGDVAGLRPSIQYLPPFTRLLVKVSAPRDALVLGGCRQTTAIYSILAHLLRSSSKSQLHETHLSFKRALLGWLLMYIKVGSILLASALGDVIVLVVFFSSPVLVLPAITPVVLAPMQVAGVGNSGSSLSSSLLVPATKQMGERGM